MHDYFLVFLSLPSCSCCKHEREAVSLLHCSNRRLPNFVYHRCLYNRDCQHCQQVAPLEALLLGLTEWILGARPNSWRAYLQSSHKAQVRWGNGSEDLWVPCMSQTEMLWQLACVAPCYSILIATGSCSPPVLCLSSLERSHRNREWFNYSRPPKVSGVAPCSKQGHIGQVAQGLVQFSAEYLWGQRNHSLSELPFNHFHGKNLFLSISSECLVLQHVQLPSLSPCFVRLNKSRSLSHSL